MDLHNTRGSFEECESLSQVFLTLPSYLHCLQQDIGVQCSYFLYRSCNNTKHELHDVISVST